MLYEEARVYLDHVSKYGSVLGLESIKGLLGELGNPQKDLTFIHIAGTNGKGSILAYLSNILREAGYRTGSYISPTVMSYLERFQIDGEYMEEETFAELTCEVKQAAERLIRKGRTSPTVFEMETAIAFLYFKKEKCDYVVLEAGMGGLLDATNIVDTTKLCIFASISMDHIGVLGDTLEEIAENKAGIIKEGAAVVTGPQRPEVMKVLERASAARHAQMVTADAPAVIHERSLDGQTFSYKEFADMTIRLLGQHQIENAATVLEAVRALRRMDVKIGEEAVRSGLEKTRWPGRFMVLGKNPTVIADGAHNADAARRLAENAESYLAGKRIVAVMGVFKDKEYEKIVDIMSPYMSFVYTVDLPNGERTLPKEELCETLARHDIASEPAETAEEAVRLAVKRAGADGAVLVFGSLSYLGEVIRLEESAAVVGTRTEKKDGDAETEEGIRSEEREGVSW